MHNFGRYPRREIAMSYPAASRRNHAQRRPESPAPVCAAVALFAERAD